jgi:hypothetical protein
MKQKTVRILIVCLSVCTATVYGMENDDHLDPSDLLRMLPGIASSSEVLLAILENGITLAPTPEEAALLKKQYEQVQRLNEKLIETVARVQKTEAHATDADKQLTGTTVQNLLTKMYTASEETNKKFVAWAKDQTKKLN